MQKAARLKVILVLILLTVNLALFLPSLKGDFLWDDKYFVSENPNLLGPRFLRGFLTSPFGGFSGVDENSLKSDESRQFYRPLTSLSYWFDFKVWGLNPAAFHLINILLHFLNAVLLFLILSRLKFDPTASFSVALLFSVFPLHFENVAWISGRTDLLSFFFGACSMLFFLRYLSARRPLDVAFSSLFFLLSLLSKETLIFLPAIYLLLYYQKGGVKKLSPVLLSFGLGLFSWLVLRGVALGAARFVYSGRSLLDFCAALGFYTFKVFYPFGLSVTVNASAVLDNPAFRVLGAALIIFWGICLFLLVKKKRGKSWVFLMVFSYVGLLLPALAILFSAATISLLAWRFLYAPSAVAIAGLVYFLLRKIKARAVGLTILGVLMVFCAAEIYPKNELFGEDDTNFWLKIKEINREDVIAKFNQGIKLLPLDERRALGLLEDILEQKDQASARYWRIRVDEELAIYFAFQKDFPKAQHYFDELLKMQPARSLHATLNYAYFLAFSGRAPEGEKIIRDAIQRFPQNHFVLIRAAKFYLIVKDYTKAAQLYAEDYRLFRNKQTLLLLQELETAQRKKGG